MSVLHDDPEVIALAYEIAEAEGIPLAQALDEAALLQRVLNTFSDEFDDEATWLAAIEADSDLARLAKDWTARCRYPAKTG